MYPDVWGLSARCMCQSLPAATKSRNLLTCDLVAHLPVSHRQQTRRRRWPTAGRRSVTDATSSTLWWAAAASAVAPSTGCLRKQLEVKFTFKWPDTREYRETVGRARLAGELVTITVTGCGGCTDSNSLDNIQVKTKSWPCKGQVCVCER